MNSNRLVLIKLLLTVFVCGVLANFAWADPFESEEVRAAVKYLNNTLSTYASVRSASNGETCADVSLSGILPYESEDVVWKQLRKIPRLRRLYVDNKETAISTIPASLEPVPPRITSKSVRQLANLNGPEWLHLTDVPLGSEWCLIAGRLRRLRALHLNQCEFDAHVVRSFATLPMLQELTFIAPAKGRLVNLDDLSGAAALTNLSLYDTRIDARDGGWVTNMKDLRQLTICHCDGYYSGMLSRLGSLEKLVELRIRSRKLTDKHIALISNVSSLETFEVEGDRLAVELGQLGRLKRLRNLTLRNLPISRAALESISRCRSLEEVTFNGCRIEAGALDAFSGLMSLRSVFVDDRTVDPRANASSDALRNSTQ